MRVIGVFSGCNGAYRHRDAIGVRVVFSLSVIYSVDPRFE
jgi:hypothetical protein